MNCQEFWNTLPAEGQEEVTEEQAGHLAECPVCAARSEQQRMLVAGLGSLREEWSREQAPDRVEAGLTAAFRMHAGFPARRPARATWWKPVFAWASAAAAMVAAGFLMVHGWQPSRPAAEHFAAPQRTVQAVPVIAASLDTETDDSASVLGDGFVRLPNAPRIDPNEAYDFVTVSFPGSEMIAMGLPVSEDRADRTVLAKVALGADGTARAVRLVSEGETF